MKILVLNSGSSSIKYKIFENTDDKFSLLYSGIEQEVDNFHIAFDKIFQNIISSKVIDSIDEIDSVGHRVVHGGEKFLKPTIITNNVIKKLKSLIKLAPLHNPANIEGIEIINKILPNIKQVAIFDTAFHSTISKENFLYPIPIEYYKKYKIRKYGFHGTSHKYIAKKYAKQIDIKLKKLNLITIHLGNGASITAIKKGKSINTSMGFTPLEGLMMGTRSGDIDPSIPLYLHQELNITVDKVNMILNKSSGFKGICQESDLRKVIDKADKGDKNSLLAIKMYINKIRKYIGSYIIELGKVDAIIFTGGIGENSKLIRDMATKDLNLLLPIDIVTIKTDEEKSIAIQTYKELQKCPR